MNWKTKFGLIALLAAGIWSGPEAVRAEVPPPAYDHIVIVMDENKNYSSIIGSSNAPFINSLARDGANFTQMYGEEHHSEGNYLWLFSGDRQNLPDYKDGISDHQFNVANLGHSLLAKGLSFVGYSEGLPSVGYVGAHSGRYVRKHNPWVNFQAVGDKQPLGDQLPASTNQPFSAFPRDYNQLPTVAWVVPDLKDDMHDGSVAQGDAWLKAHLGDYCRWAITHNSLLIFTFDENGQSKPGPTDPRNHDNDNRIATIFYGAGIKPGNYAEGAGVTHVNVLRTIEAMYGLSPEGAQAPAATRAGISDHPITDVFVDAPAGSRPAAGGSSSRPTQP